MEHETLAWELIGVLLPPLLFLWPLWLLLGMLIVSPAALRLGFSWYERRRLARSGIWEIDRMDGLTFERFLEGLFQGLGFRVERTRFRGDYGADLLLWKEGVRTVVQAKRGPGSG